MLGIKTSSEIQPSQVMIVELAFKCGMGPYGVIK
jgi:hypothetical protein